MAPCLDFIDHFTEALVVPFLEVFLFFVFRHCTFSLASPITAIWTFNFNRTARYTVALEHPNQRATRPTGTPSATARAMARRVRGGQPADLMWGRLS